MSFGPGSKFKRTDQRAAALKIRVDYARGFLFGSVRLAPGCFDAGPLPLGVDALLFGCCPGASWNAFARLMMRALDQLCQALAGVFAVAVLAAVGTAFDRQHAV
jgi:hypothetical protein